MSVKIKISSAHQHAANGQEVVEANGDTISQCLKDLTRQYPSLDQLMYNDSNTISDYLLVFLNGANIPHNELNKPVTDHDDISLVMLIDGG